jgi:hypothetical protein
VVLAAMTAEPFTSAAEEISALAAEQTVLLGGAGAGAAPELAGGLGARVLPAGPTRAAELTAAELPN